MGEVDESMFSDEIRRLDALRNKIAALRKTALGVSVRVKLVEPKSIQRSEGNAVRVLATRNPQQGGEKSLESRFSSYQYFLRTARGVWTKSFPYLREMR